MITNNPDVDVDVAGIIITGGIGSNDEAEYAAEVYDVFTGVSCEVPQLPDKRQGHTQVIFDKSIVRIRMFHRTTICQGDNYTDKNFVPPLKTRSPVVEAVKLMAWRLAKSP